MAESSKKVTVFEVGPRDGLQNESRPVSLADKIWFTRGLIAAGVKEFELGAFVREDKVPQMADTASLYEAIRKGRIGLGRARAWSLVPNRRGLERALKSGVKQIAIFTAASESFNQKNIGMGIRESLDEYRALMKDAKQAGLRVRGYVSTAFGCPYEGKVAASKVWKVTEALLALGVSEVSVGDTIGVATPGDVDRVMAPMIREHGAEPLAVHFHDTRGTALANSLRAIEQGIRTIDSSAGGLGGCPFAPGATGNLATEDLVYMLDGLGLKSGIDLDQLCEVSLGFAKKIGRPLSSRYLSAYASGRRAAPRKT